MTRRSKGWTTSPTGSLRFNRDFPRIGVGRITCSARTRNPSEFARRDGILTKLRDDGQTDVLLALKEGRISIEELVSADRENRLRGSELLTEMRLRASLWEVVQTTIPHLGTSPGTRKRYEVSLAALRKRGVAFVPERASVADLARVDWKGLQATWERSAADWNHVRRAVSALLTAVLDDKFHPFRRRVMRGFPKARETSRVPDLSRESFKRLLEAASPTVRPSLMVLAITGMRVGEYLACEARHLNPETCVIQIPGTKTAGSAAPLPVPQEAWPWVAAAIPSRLRYKALRLHFKAACAKSGIEGLRIHDLRHCFAQWATDGGVVQSKIQAALRHVSPAQTAQYSAQRDRGEASRAVVAYLGEASA